MFHNAPRGEATEVYGADRWMAPELFTDISEFKRTKESDVYAFACTLLEVSIIHHPIHSIFKYLSVVHRRNTVA